MVLPSTSGSGTPTLADYAYVSAMPNTPDGNGFEAGFDPHTVTAYTSPNTNKSYAVPQWTTLPVLQTGWELLIWRAWWLSLARRVPITLSGTPLLAPVTWLFRRSKPLRSQLRYGTAAERGKIKPLSAVFLLAGPFGHWSLDSSRRPIRGVGDRGYPFRQKENSSRGPSYSDMVRVCYASR